MIIAIASDHNGCALRTALKERLLALGYFCVDLGPFGKETVDYVDYARQLGEIVARRDVSRGILICGTGIGMSIVANKVPGVRAAVVHNDQSAVKSVEHNASNVLCLGSWIRPDAENINAAELWLSGEFGEHRHVRRVEMIEGPRRGKIVFANGVFDILHQGHIQMLRWARDLGHWLVVGINSDASVRALKGIGRPINSAEDRKAVLESMRFVDEVIIFDDLKATALIDQLQPDVIVKGGEWLAEEVRLRDMIPPEIEIKIFPMVEGYSTSAVVERMRTQ